MTLWFDVNDLFQYVQHNQRLSGVQRLTFEIYNAAEKVGPREFALDIGYVRLDPSTGRFAVIPWTDVLSLWTALTIEAPTTPPARAVHVPPRPQPQPPEPFTRRVGSSITQTLPARARPHFQRFCLLQMGALRASRTLFREIFRRGNPVQTPPEETVAVPLSMEGDDDAPPSWAIGWLDRSANSGDWLLSFGASWNWVGYGERVNRLLQSCPIRLALLVYDLIPLRRPEWCHHTLVRDFAVWLRTVLPRADALFAISQATRLDLSDYIRQAEVPINNPIGLLSVGSGFSNAPQRHPTRTHVPEPFVLFVSTIEPRKNHQLLVQVWRWLLEQRPPEDVPTLVFAGRIGWMVEDLLDQLANTNYLDGKIVMVEELTDDLLEALYKRCLFTVFPSQFEGWGLPVTESLAYGKPCLASNATSLPEAGGRLARYFNPDDFPEVCNAFAEVIFKPELLPEWTEAVRRDFVPSNWEHSVSSILDDLGLKRLATTETEGETAVVDRSQ